MAIGIKNLQYRWGKHLPLVLEIPQLEIQEGERVFLRGPSGSGKSTLLNLVGGVLEPLDGELEVLGHDFSQDSGRTRDRVRGDHMGFIFQQFNLMPYLSVLENVLLPVRFSKTRLEKIKDKNTTPEAEATRLLKSLGLDAAKIIGRPVTQLSVGQQQRVAAARAMIGWPSLVIADEPTSALDSDARENFINALFAEVTKSRASMVFVSHDRTLGHLFDRQLDLVELNLAYQGEGAVL